MKRIVVSALATIACSVTLAQAPVSVQWQKCYGSSSGDEFRSVEPTRDGGYILAGSTSGRDGMVPGMHQRKDVYVVKVDTAGVRQWHKAYGGSMDESATTILPTSDGGYIVAASTNSNDGDISFSQLRTDVWILKLNSKGDIEWQKNYGGKGDDEVSTIIATRDGGYLFGGKTNSKDGDVTANRGADDGWLVKINARGSVEWQKTYAGRILNDGVNAVRQTPDGGYIVAAFASSMGNDVQEFKGVQDFWIFKTDSRGEIQWQKAYGGRQRDIPYDIQLTGDGGYVVAGSSQSVDFDVPDKRGRFDDYWLVKISGSGELQWQKTFGGSRNEIAYSVIQTRDGGYLVAGAASSADGDVTGLKGGDDIWLIKTDASGNLSWQKTLGGSYDDKGFSLKPTPDNRFVIAGHTASNNGDIISKIGNYDGWLVKVLVK